MSNEQKDLSSRHRWFKKKRGGNTGGEGGGNEDKERRGRGNELRAAD